jgi:hypothetical protein
LTLLSHPGCSTFMGASNAQFRMAIRNSKGISTYSAIQFGSLASIKTHTSLRAILHSSTIICLTTVFTLSHRLIIPRHVGLITCSSAVGRRF